MINNNITLSKIVATPTEHSWAQAYSTLNLYIVLSVETDVVEEETVATQGKELLERLQREFFALDEKTLSSIKAAVENAAKGISHKLQSAIVLATIVDNLLYIVTEGHGMVVLKRGHEFGIVAEGEDKKVISFSGILENNDTIAIGTPGFFKKVPPGQLAELLHTGTVVEQGENIAPIIHGNAAGTEAAVLVHYKHHTASHAAEEQTDETEEEAPLAEESARGVPSRFHAPSIPKLPKLSLPRFQINRLTLIVSSIILLVIILAVSLFVQNQRSKTAALDTKADAMLADAQKRYDEANSLMSIQQSLANDDLTKLQSSLQADESQFPENSPQRKRIEAFLAKVNTALSGSGTAASVKNQKTIYDPQSAKEIQTLGAVTDKGGVLTVIDSSSGTIAFLDPDGTVKDSLKTSAKTITGITGDKNTLMILAGDGVYTADRGAKSAKKSIPLSSVSDLAGIDTFFGNIYLLNKTDKTIDKYAGGGSTKSSYLSSGQSLANTPLSFSIDSSVWVIETGGTLERFTKGKSDGISVKGIPNSLGSHLQIYTDQDYTGVYILDSDNGRVVALDKNGSFTTQYAAEILKSASSFAVDEPDKKVFVISGNKLISFDL